MRGGAPRFAWVCEAGAPGGDHAAGCFASRGWRHLAAWPIELAATLGAATPGRVARGAALRYKLHRWVKVLLWVRVIVWLLGSYRLKLQVLLVRMLL